MPSCVYRRTILMVIPFKITKWGKFIHSCTKHRSPRPAMGQVYVSDQRCKPVGLQVQTRFQSLVFSRSILQHISASPALLLQPSEISPCVQAHGPIPHRVWRNTGRSHPLPLCTLSPPHACEMSLASVAEMWV